MLSQPGWLDHLAVLVLVGVVPFLAAREYARLVRNVEADVVHARVRAYLRTTILQWVIALGLVAGWLLAGRTLAALGLTVPGAGRLVGGAAVTALVLAVLWRQWKAVTALDEPGLRGMQEQMESVAPLLPRTEREAAHFRLLSLTAGICEEIVYRGYLIWYLGTFIGVWPAAVAAGVLFGILHLYQGPAGIVRTGAIGILMALLYVGTGSLLWPMLVHVALDLHGGAVGRRVLSVEAA